MSQLAVLGHGYSLFRPATIPRSSDRRPLRHSSCFHVRHRLFAENKHKLVAHLFRPQTFRIRSQQADAENYEVTISEDVADQQDRIADVVLREGTNTHTGGGISFLAKIAIVLGLAATATFICVGIKQPILGSLHGFQFHAEGSSAMAVPPAGFTFKAFGYRIVLPEYAPGWVYFWLLMAAGCGFFISEEALNIWVGISIARMLTLDGTWQSFADSFYRNAPYIISTILWVYWGVCISDLIPFYLGRLFRQSGASDDVSSKLRIDKERALRITCAVQKYGNLSGFVERLSVGARNPTGFLAGAMGISPECFFAGVCGGGLITLPIQLGIGFLLRERPLYALATVATAVGIWTIFPYAVAALTAVYLYLRPPRKNL
ncbi:hypothetical protein FNV43_RR23067 [Rhamnella rubrinervis]|uniref:Uncharacterized protein n=1 Tax=Rhamnella rubrinervis TaxID=2594499 RepID=A0A8K0DY86_9ROSA|nr:hypothetical protein FNV43_RR23067 [Rhamnella rubrinervis]